MKKDMPSVFCALVTPCDAHGNIDEAGLSRYVEALLYKGVRGFVPCGSTGEGLCFSNMERKKVATIVRKIAGKEAFVMPGVWGVTTKETIQNIVEAQEAGADAVLALTPHYIRGSQQGLVDYFQKIHDETHIPIMIYHNPTRSGMYMSPETIISIQTLCTRIVAIKDSSPDMERVLMLRSAAPTLGLFSGDDSTCLAYIAHGGNGVISVLANILPEHFLHITQEMVNNNYHAAQKKVLSCVPFLKAIACATNPLPAYTILAHLYGFGCTVPRSPTLGTLSFEQHQCLMQCLKDYNLL